MKPKLELRREHTGNRQLDVMQRNTEQAARKMNDCPFIAGVLRSVRLVAATPKTVDHGLGVAAAFFVVRTNYDGTGTAAAVTSSASGSQDVLDQKRQHSVVADVNCTVDLWFYPIASEAQPR